MEVRHTPDNPFSLFSVILYRYEIEHFYGKFEDTKVHRTQTICKHIITKYTG